VSGFSRTLRLSGPALALLAAEMRAIHRLVEEHAATSGETIAIADCDRGVSYRELNAAANVLARRLMALGFRRGMHADVRLCPSVDLAVILLAILKAGGRYTWCDAEPVPAGNQHVIRVTSSPEEQWEIRLDDVMPGDLRCGPNLPVVTRETDIACLLERGGGQTPIAVPHATVMALKSHSVGDQSPWTGEPGAFDLWIPLMCGTTAVVSAPRAAAA